MTFQQTLLPGTFVLAPKFFSDARGTFVKTFHAGAFADLGIPFQPAEEFYSTSNKNVVRGMHFQRPPRDHAKLVYCLNGRVLDVLLDLRKTSPAFGRAAAVELSATNRLLCYIPPGIAHGFVALEDDSLMIYKTSTVHAPEHDAGVRWDSFGFDWRVSAPILSSRDLGFPPLAEFSSPF